jgi:NADH-quinone oxidoreductase subunit J
VQLIAFYILSTVVVLSALFVIAARNPVHSVLWLICAFFTSAGLLVLIGAEFLAMLLVVVYVGAVAVLFLCVVKKLYIGFASLRWGYS